MRVYLDNCCYNRPFGEQGQLSVSLETEAKLAVQRFGDVNAERFIALTNRAQPDYAKWREKHMYVGESVRETAARTRSHASLAEKLFPRHAVGA